jgi:DTW domain-containing protein
MTRREICSHCTRPLSACICRWVAPVHSAVHVLILQHPLEVGNAKGSARLLQLSVANTSMAVGEAFDPAELSGLLREGGRQPVLLYPDLPGERALGLPAPPPLDSVMLDDLARVRLVILDGTWRKSRKMLYQNRLLQALPRLALSDVPDSRYTIRKAHAPHQLSTLEAACCALGQLHEDDAAFLPVLKAFDEFVAHFHATSGKLGASTS